MCVCVCVCVFIVAENYFVLFVRLARYGFPSSELFHQHACSFSLTHSHSHTHSFFSCLYKIMDGVDSSKIAQSHSSVAGGSSNQEDSASNEPATKVSLQPMSNVEYTDAVIVTLTGAAAVLACLGDDVLEELLDEIVQVGRVIFHLLYLLALTAVRFTYFFLLQFYNIDGYSHSLTMTSFFQTQMLPYDRIGRRGGSIGSLSAEHMERRWTGLKKLLFAAEVSSDLK